MNSTNKQTLLIAKENLLGNYKKINTSCNMEVLHLNDEERTVSYIVNYDREINAIESKQLSKIDTLNLKKYAGFYKYWLDLSKQTISIQGRIHSIYKVHGCIYFRDKKSGNIINGNKEFALAKQMNRIRPSEIIGNIIKNCETTRNKHKHEQ